MRLVVEFAVGYALQKLSSVLHLFFEFEQQDLCECHTGTITLGADDFGPQSMRDLKESAETSARLLELLSLFQAQRYWSGGGLCERLIRWE